MTTPTTVPGRRRTRLTDADFAAMVKRYEDAGDVQNADIIRRQWEAAKRGARNRKPRNATDEAC